MGFLLIRSNRIRYSYMEAIDIAISFIKRFEGLATLTPDKQHIKAYICPAGVPTIGYGNTFYPNGQKVTINDIITIQRAEEILRWTVGLFANDVKSLVKSTLTENQKASLISFAYNVGSDIDIDTIPEGLGDSTLLKKVNANPNDLTIVNEFMKWDKAWVTKDGVKHLVALPGLIKRRQEEAQLYFTK